MSPLLRGEQEYAASLFCFQAPSSPVKTTYRHDPGTTESASPIGNADSVCSIHLFRSPVRDRNVRSHNSKPPGPATSETGAGISR